MWLKLPHLRLLLKLTLLWLRILRLLILTLLWILGPLLILTLLWILWLLILRERCALLLP